MRPCYGVDDRRAEAGPLCRGGVSEREHVVALGRRDSGAVVSDVAPVRQVANGDRHVRPAVLDVVAGLRPADSGTVFHTVPEEALEQLAQPAPIGADRPLCRCHERRVDGLHVSPAVAGDRRELERSGLDDVVPALCEPQEVIDQLPIRVSASAVASRYSLSQASLASSRFPVATWCGLRLSRVSTLANFAKRCVSRSISRPRCFCSPMSRWIPTARTGSPALFHT